MNGDSEGICVQRESIKSHTFATASKSTTAATVAGSFVAYVACVLKILRLEICWRMEESVDGVGGVGVAAEGDLSMERMSRSTRR